MAAQVTCTAAPIRQPLTGELLGAVDLTCGLRASRTMPLSLLTTAARLVESQLLTAALRERERVRDRYDERVARRYGTRSALVGTDGVVVHADPPDWLPRTLPPPVEGTMTLPDGQPVAVERLGAEDPYLVLPMMRDEPPTLRLTTLGRERVLVRVNETTRELSRRHSDLVVCLALAHPDGLSAAALARAAYGEHGKPLTVRGELPRLRPALGGRLAADPYRLVGELAADFRELDDAVETAPVDELLDRYPGPLLPSSSAPQVVAARNRLDERLRARTASP